MIIPPTVTHYRGHRQTLFPVREINLKAYADAILIQITWPALEFESRVMHRQLAKLSAYCAKPRGQGLMNSHHKPKTSSSAVAEKPRCTVAQFWGSACGGCERLDGVLRSPFSLLSSSAALRSFRKGPCHRCPGFFSWRASEPTT